MAKRDFFADLAATYKATRGGLAPSEPLMFEKKPFAASAQKAARPEILTHEEKAKAYRAQIAALRGQYEPFLCDRSAPLSLVRKRTELEDFDFRFETSADNGDFNAALLGSGEWEKVKIPHYRGPVGRWTAFYRTPFTYHKTAGRRVWLCFEGADYEANVYLNGRFVGSHEGMFSPFSFDVTKTVREGENVLLVEIKNDYPTVGIDGGRIDGEKLYAATGIGWDDPADGWHHCPPGAGIYHTVVLEERPEYFIQAVFPRTDIDAANVEFWVDVYNSTGENYCDEGKKALSFDVEVMPYNFDGAPYEKHTEAALAKTGPGLNFYRASFAMGDYQLWTLEAPCLYKAIVSLYDHEGTLLDQYAQTFGMRKFHMDEDGNGGDKGSLFFNNKPILLRGANDMGHMQLAVCRKDWEQLIEDILIAKVANMNFYRFTQRPVQKEIYHYCDMLGMLNQSDLPLFARMRRTQFYEGIRQTGEMERHIRSHPSSIMVTYINEAFGIEREGSAHRHLTRPELEMFFECCDRAIKLENPDRVIKRVEGDYDPPTEDGLSDFHCYNMWYTNHALPIGRLYKNHLPATRIGWKTGCGEYGTEGLDSYKIMSGMYPKDWLPDEDGTWLPDRIVNAQSNNMHGDWYEEQEGIHAWIEESQRHQALATKLMTDALRRRSDKVVSTAIHLLIDAWPAGWMKVLVGVDREPKPAFFEFQNSQKPLKLNLRGDRWTAYAGETIDWEAWLLNDLPDDQDDLVMVATLRDDKRDYQSFEMKASVAAASPLMAGVIRAALPDVSADTTLYLDAELRKGGKVIDTDRMAIKVYLRAKAEKTVICIGKRAARAALDLGLTVIASKTLPSGAATVLISDPAADLSGVPGIIAAGGRVLLLPPDEGTKGWSLPGAALAYQRVRGGEPTDFGSEYGVAFVARDPHSPYSSEFGPQDFAYLYNADKDFIDAAAVNAVVPDGLDIHPILFGYQKPSFFGRIMGHKKRLPVIGELGERVFVAALNTDGRTGVNPTLDRLLLNILMG